MGSIGRYYWEPPAGVKNFDFDDVTMTSFTKIHNLKENMGCNTSVESSGRIDSISRCFTEIK